MANGKRTATERNTVSDRSYRIGGIAIEKE
jgi:hypothetical protein